MSRSGKASPKSPKRAPAAAPRATAQARELPAVSEEAFRGSRLGRIVGADAGSGVRVDYDGNIHGPLAAQTTLALSPEVVERAIAARQPAVLLFDGADSRRPLLVGLIQPAKDAKLLEELLEPLPAPTPADPLVAKVDGKRVVIEGEQEVVLRCGEATITLQSDGKVVVRGTQIVSTAKGTHRIRGGAVRIN